jgi:hypothetical protein
MGRTAANAAPSVPSEVESAIADYPDAVRDRILALRAHVWDVAAADPAIGPLEETLKWGQPSYLTMAPRTGPTVRIDRIGSGTDVAIFTHCQTSLVKEFVAIHGDLLETDGTRAVIVPATGAVPWDALREHVRSALLYHRR